MPQKIKIKKGRKEKTISFAKVTSPILLHPAAPRNGGVLLAMRSGRLVRLKFPKVREQPQEVVGEASIKFGAIRRGQC